jgi:dolichol-phosphate mannosyltransferase
MAETAVALRARVTVVVPTYNEADNLPALARRLAAAMPEAELLVVDDASIDGTAGVARALSAKVVERVGERGLSTAVLRGVAEARTDLVVVMDADLSHPPEAVPALVRAVEEGADVAVGSRYVPGGDIDRWPLLRRLTSKAGTLLARPLTSVRDPMAGFFCLRRSSLRGVELRPRGFKILLEILARVRPGRVVEVPIRFEDREAGKSKFDGRERREFLKQVWALYRDLNAWPLRVAKFLATGALGYALHLAVLVALVEGTGLAPLKAAAAAFGLAMTSNYALNRFWTFRAREARLASSFAAYAAGALGGLAVQLGAMHLLRSFHYALSASAGIALGAAVTFLTSQAWAFAKRS